MFDSILFSTSSKHLYTLAATGIKFDSRTFSSRQVAESYMYSYIDKHGIQINEIWDDKHYKTYCCKDGIKFYINRI